MHATPEGTIRLPRPPRATRRIKMGVKKHFTGSLVIGDDEGEILEFESHTEKMTALVMLSRPEVTDLEGQVPFHWTDKAGKTRTHFADFRVSLRDGTRIALIVKNSKKAADPEFRADMRFLATQMMPDFADRVSLITEKHLDPIELHNAELIHSVRLPDPEVDVAVQQVSEGIKGAVPIADLAQAAGYPGRGFLAAVRLIRKHELELVAHERIEPETLVRRRVV